MTNISVGNSKTLSLTIFLSLSALIVCGVFIQTAQAQKDNQGDKTTKTTTPNKNSRDVEIVFWESIKNSTDAEDFKAYLKKYPDGEFADLALIRIKNIESRQTNQNKSPIVIKLTENQFWDSVKFSSNVQDFKRYLEKYPNGKFKVEAKDKIVRILIRPGEYYQIISVASDKCLDVDDNLIGSDGAKVQQWRCHGGNNQLWKFTQYNGGYKINIKASGKCFDLDDNRLNYNGAIIQQWNCTGNDNQTWLLDFVNDTFVITSKRTGKCVDVDDTKITTNGARVQQWDCRESENQSWRIIIKE